MSADPLIDEDYASEEDSDFAPDAAAPADEESGSESEAEAEADDGQGKENKSKRKRQRDDVAEDVDFENSGDEAIVQKGKRRRKSKKKKAGADIDDDHDGDADGDEGGEGGLVKTRRQRAQEKAERKAQHATSSGPITIDVDDIWAKMTAAPVVPPKADAPKTADAAAAQDNNIDNNNKRRDGDAAASEGTKSKGKGKGDSHDTTMIKIKRTYNFAGKVHTEEKLVARDSAEAKVYLASLGRDKQNGDYDPDAHPENEVEEEEEEEQKPKPRKAFRSRFEPVAAEGLTQRDDLNLGISTRQEMREQQQRARAKEKAKKLNVVEKSRMDWAGFVDKEGIKDELELAGKSKESFASRQDFLRRVEAKKEEEARRARIAGRV